MAEEEQKRGTKILPNGAVYDLDKGRIVANPGGGTHAITKDNAKEFLAMRAEKRRALAREAANEAVQRGDFKTKYGDSAFIAEIVHNAQLKSQNIDDPKSIEASRFVLAVTGEAETDGAPGGSVAVTELSELFRSLADMARSVRAIDSE